MRKLLFIVFPALVLLPSILPAQQADTIIFVGKQMSGKWFIGSESIKTRQVYSLLESNTCSSGKNKSFKTKTIIGTPILLAGTVFGVAGLIKIPSEWGLLNMAVDEVTADKGFFQKRSTKNLLISGGFFVVSLPLLFSGNSDLKKSVTLYNSNIKKSNINQSSISIGIGIDIGEFSLALRF